MVGWIWKRAAISDVVWSPLRAARATLDLNDALYCLRFLLMILLLVEMMNQRLGTCPNFGIHFTQRPSGGWEQFTACFNCLSMVHQSAKVCPKCGQVTPVAPFKLEKKRRQHDIVGKCLACDAEITAQNAMRCPNCGKDSPTLTEEDKFQNGLWGTVALLVGGLFFYAVGFEYLFLLVVVVGIFVLITR